jgi:hypothetical protein
MRSIRIPTLLAAGAALALFAGCDGLTDGRQQAPATDTWEQETNFTDPFGGYTFSDEADAFGDPALRAIEIAEAATPSADADSMPIDSTGTAFAVRILWGQLEGNRDAQRLLDWTGSLQVSQGSLGVLRVVAFERLQGDHLVLPRPNRQTLEFVSHTQPHFDGLVVVVRPGPATTDGTLSFATGPLTQSWTYAELRGANLVIPVDDAGNAVSVVGARLPAPGDLCARGFVRGHWLHRDDARGVFRGVWVASNGLPVGHIRGHFGSNAAGEHVWFGKIVGRGGRLLGVARGGYTPSDDPAQPGGTFAGRILVRPNMETGRVEGHYLPGRPDGMRSDLGDPRLGRPGAAGFFEGRWSIGCPDPQ